MENIHNFVDLGLPSGTLWATCNIGATKPEDYGDYFAWGETVPFGKDDESNLMNYNSMGTYTKTEFDWATYKWCYGSFNSQTKYCTDNIYGAVDNKTELDLEDDAAYVNWGKQWRMPSLTQIVELVSSAYTTTERTFMNGVYGCKITSKKNGNSIFLPFAGCRYGSSLDNAGEYGYYWSRTLYSDYPYYAYYLCFSSCLYDWYYFSRFSGHSVRPVLAKRVTV